MGTNVHVATVCILTFRWNLLTGSELHQAEGERGEELGLVISGAKYQVPVVDQLVQHVQDDHLRIGHGKHQPNSENVPSIFLAQYK